MLVLGRAGMDFYADPPGTRAETAERFFACLGGSAGNIAAGLVRLDVPAGLVSAVSDDAVGRFVLNQLDGYGIGTHHVHVRRGEARTSLSVTETRIGDTQTVIYRNGAADFDLREEDVAAIDCPAHGGLVVTGTALAAEPSRGATRAAIERAGAAGLPAILDLDYRPYSWASPQEAAEICRAAAACCDMVLGNDEEFAVMAGGADGNALARSLAEEGRIAVYKMGERGSETFHPDGRFRTGIFGVEAIKPMGAGDAFMAALIASLASGRDLREAVRRGSAAAAMVVSGIGCAPAMPTEAALDRFIADHPAPPPA